MNLDSFLQEYTSLKNRLAEMKNNNFDDLANQVAEKMFGEVFRVYPQLVGFSFLGYTPYFNDGDECVYRVYLLDEGVAVTKGSLDLQGECLNDSLEAALKSAGFDLDTVEGVSLLYNRDQPWQERERLEKETGREALRRDVEAAVNAAEEFFKDFLPDHSQFSVIRGQEGLTMLREDLDHE